MLVYSCTCEITTTCIRMGLNEASRGPLTAILESSNLTNYVRFKKLGCTITGEAFKDLQRRLKCPNLSDLLHAKEIAALQCLCA